VRRYLWRTPEPVAQTTSTHIIDVCTNPCFSIFIPLRILIEEGINDLSHKPNYRQATRGPVDSGCLPVTATTVGDTLVHFVGFPTRVSRSNDQAHATPANSRACCADDEHTYYPRFHKSVLFDLYTSKNERKDNDLFDKPNHRQVTANPRLSSCSSSPLTRFTTIMTEAFHHRAPANVSPRQRPAKSNTHLPGRTCRVWRHQILRAAALVGGPNARVEGTTAAFGLWPR
jgi:hypothetical protein